MTRKVRPHPFPWLTSKEERLVLGYIKGGCRIDGPADAKGRVPYHWEFPHPKTKQPVKFATDGDALNWLSTAVCTALQKRDLTGRLMTHAKERLGLPVWRRGSVNGTWSRRDHKTRGSLGGLVTLDDGRTMVVSLNVQLIEGGRKK